MSYEGASVCESTLSIHTSMLGVELHKIFMLRKLAHYEMKYKTVSDIHI